MSDWRKQEAKKAYEDFVKAHRSYSHEVDNYFHMFSKQEQKVLLKAISITSKFKCILKGNTN